MIGMVDTYSDPYCNATQNRETYNDSLYGLRICHFVLGICDGYDFVIGESEIKWRVAWMYI